jgi:hypothetical protein
MSKNYAGNGTLALTLADTIARKTVASRSGPEKRPNLPPYA